MRAGNGRDTPSVVLNLSGATAHHRYLAEALARAGILRRAVMSGLDLDLLESDSEGRLRLRRRFSSYRFCHRAIWGISRRLPAFQQGPQAILALSSAVDWGVARSLPACNVFHGLMGVCLASLRKAKRLGATGLVDTTTLHPLAFQREMLAACERNGIGIRECEHILPRRLLERQEREYETCDKIIVYSAAAQRSFEPFGYACKTVVVHPGVDHEFFTPAAGPREDSTFRVCYVGRIEAAKNIDYLIQAWNRLALRDSELVLVGRVFPEIGAAAESRSSFAPIRFAGILSCEEVAQCYRRSDLFVFPSVNEGLPLALLEAMSCGVPVIACRDTGAADCVAEGVNGWLVAGNDSDALAAAIQHAYERRNELARLGGAARARVEESFTLRHCAERVIGLYGGMVGEHRRPT